MVPGNASATIVANDPFPLRACIDCTCTLIDANFKRFRLLSERRLDMIRPLGALLSESWVPHKLSRRLGAIICPEVWTIDIQAQPPGDIDLWAFVVAEIANLTQCSVGKIRRGRRS